MQLFCIFFVVLSLSSITFINTKAAGGEPQPSFYINGNRTQDVYGVWVQSHYQMFLKDYDKVKGTAIYSVGVWWELEGKTELKSDDVYVNGVKVGTFDGNNGIHSGVVERGQWIDVTLTIGDNLFETRNVGGVGGDIFITITVDKFGSPPVVTGTDGTWYAGEVSSGVRTWASLYTDGATGNAEQNKVQTSTGFMYFDEDECPNGVNAYDANPVGDNARITKIVNETGAVVEWTALDKKGTYTVYTQTTDSSGQKGEGSRKIKVVNKTYNIGYNGNGATSGRMMKQIAEMDTSINLLKNTYSRTGYTFYNWNTKADGSGQSYTNGQAVKNLTNEAGKTVYLYAQWSPISYNIKYVPNGGTGSDVTASVKYNVYHTIKEDIFSRKGYKIKNWNTKADGSGTSYDKGTLVKNLSATQGATITLYAQWELENYSITYDLQGGVVNGNPTSYTVLSDSITLKNPTRLGYTFTGWTGSNGSAPQTTVTINKGSSGNRNYVANWKANTYKISYLPNGGTGTMTGDTVAYDQNYTIKTNSFSRLGYTFANWNTKADGSGKVYKTGDIVKNLTAINNETINLYAQWTLDTYSITYNLNGGTVTGNPTSYTVLSDSITLKNPIRTGYTFLGWTGSNGATPQTTVIISKGSTGNRSYVANWKANTYKISYLPNGGTGTMSPDTVTYDQNYTIKANSFSRLGYTFTSWNTKADGSGKAYKTGDIVKNLTAISNENINLYAQWSLDTYSITYNLNGGSVTGNPSSYTVLSDTIALKNPTRTGYTFTGWTGSNGTTPQMNVTIPKGSTGNKSYVANWKLNTYSISYDLQGGNVSGNPTTYTVETDTFTLNNPTRVGYTFVGWTGSNGATPQTTVTVKKGSTGNKSYMANWKANSYKVTYLPNGGIGTMAADTVTYDERYVIKENGFTKNGYTFVNWNTKADGTGTTYSSGVSVKNLTSTNNETVSLYAQWKLNNYSITYDLQGGSVSGNPTAYTVETASFTLNNPIKQGYTFTGWSGSNGTVPQTSVTIVKGSTGNKSFIANWDENPTLTLKSFSVIEGDDFPKSNLISGNGYITKGDSEFPDKLQEVTYPASAKDKEDGDISNKINIVKVVNPKGDVVDTVDTSKPGVYTVTYSVQDSVHAIITGSRTITVLPASTAKIEAVNRYFYVNTEITKEELLSKVSATDKYDGNITGNVNILDFANIKSDTVGEYEITFEVTNRSHKSTSKIIKVYIIDTIDTETKPHTIRFISKEFIDTLSPDSKWKTNNDLYVQLCDSLNKSSREEAISIYNFSYEDIKEVKKGLKENGFEIGTNKYSRNKTR